MMRTANRWRLARKAILVLKRPWPAMLRTIYKDPDRYVEQYWSKYPGVYFTGDSARKDEDGYFWIIGRVDDVLKVSGYRLGTAEIESALVSHPAVAEAAAIGLPHEVKGNAIYTYVILTTGYEPSDALAEELRLHVGHEVGPIAKPETGRVCGLAAQDAQRQDHAPRAQGTGARLARRGSDDAGNLVHCGDVARRLRAQSTLAIGQRVWEPCEHWCPTALVCVDQHAVSVTVRALGYHDSFVEKAKESFVAFHPFALADVELPAPTGASRLFFPQGFRWLPVKLKIFSMLPQFEQRAGITP